LPGSGTATRDPHRLLEPPQPPEVVVADDHPPTLEVYRALLEPLGLRVHAAEDGASALALVRAFRPELCILDLHMPGMDGYEAARAIRSLAETPRPFLLACSASVLEEDSPAARAAGFDAFLAKPFQVAAFAELMELRRGWRFAWIELDFEAPESAADLGRCPAELEGPLREALLIGDLGRIAALVGELSRLNGPLAAQANRLLQAFNLVGLEALLFGLGEPPPSA
jgi:CheY-like chemotaxis protein